MSELFQKEFFLNEGGDAWYSRSVNAKSTFDVTQAYLFDAVKGLPFSPQRFLEIGCSSGKKIQAIAETFSCECYGIDPSSSAIAEGSKLSSSDVHLKVGTADSLPFKNNFFDIVYFGFCLYLCDRSSLFAIAQEAHRVLRDGGAIMILDFESRVPLRNSFCHTEQSIWSYKMEYEKMFTWHPQYIVSEKRSYSHSTACFDANPNERLALTTIIKVTEDEALSTNPWNTNVAK